MAFLRTEMVNQRPELNRQLKIRNRIPVADIRQTALVVKLEWIGMLLVFYNLVQLLNHILAFLARH